MKTKNIITIVLFCSFYITVQTQNDNENLLANVQATINNAIEEASDKVAKPSRMDMLRKSDIRLRMIAKNDKGRTRLDNPGPTATGGGDGFYMYKSGNDEIYAEFDWDNVALSMLGSGSTTEYYDGTKAMGGTEIYKEVGDEIMQYTDKDGYWYVPYDDPNGKHKHIKFNAKELIVGGLNDLIDLASEENAENLMFLLEETFKTIDWDDLGYEYHAIAITASGTLNEMIKKLASEETKKQLKDGLKELISEELSQIGGFPIFIHWALLYSPDSIKAKFQHKETTVPFRGIPNCTKIQVTSGEESGKSMIFDQYDRLVFINALNDGTAEYFYDKDVTVKIPPAATLSSIMGEFQTANKEESSGEAKESTVDALKAALEAANKEAERKKEIERLRNEELAKLEEQLKEAVTPQEKEAIQQKIKELKELREKENNN